jgi:acetylornithine deacetylase
MGVEEILKKLVSFSVLGGESNLEIAAWIENYLKDYGVDCTSVPNEEGNKRSLHCRIGPPVDDGVILSGHMDVVPVAGQEWTSEPFVLTDKSDGKLYGRGSCDMKAYIACCLSMVPIMMKAELKIPIYFAFSYDEEIGCLAAPELAEHIKTTYNEKPKYAIIGEPSMMQAMVGQKGMVIYKTTINGSAGHSSRIRTEVSAIQEACRMILWLEQKMHQLIGDGHVDDRFSPPHTTIHCGKFLEAGIAPNVIADKACFYWDVRVIPKDKAVDILAEFEQYSRAQEEVLRERFPDFQIITEESHPDVPALDTPEKASIVELIKSIIPNQELSTVAYAAEAGQFAEAGFESIICGPGDIAQAHRADEFVDKEQLQQCNAMLQELIIKLSK